MNYQTWSKKKFWMVVFGILLLGMLIAPKGNSVITKEVPIEKIVTKEVVKEVPKEVIKEVPAKYDDTNWRTLKYIDDQAINYAVEELGYCSAGFTAISNGDIETLESLAPKITAVTAKVDALTVQRQAVLGKLGY